MARSVITKPATLRKLSALTNRPIMIALARGNTDHRIDAIEADRTIWHVYRDGTIERSEYKAAPHLVEEAKP